MITRNPKKSAQKPAAKPAQKKAEAKARKFIGRGAAGNGVPREMVPTLISFDRPFLDRIDQAARLRGLNRTAFVTSVLAEHLLRSEGAQ